jgi:transposase
MKHSVHSHTSIEHDGTQDREHNHVPGNGHWRKLSKSEIEPLLAMYKDPEKTTAEIAACFGIHPSSVTNVAKRAGLPLRGRGGRPRSEPLPAVQAILSEAWTTTYAEAAARLGLSKQRVGQLVKRWEAWAVAQFGPRKIKPDETAEEQVQRSADPIRPHIITFRVTDSELTKLAAQSGSGAESWARSPHSAARFLLLRLLDGTPNANCEASDTVGFAP